MDDVPILPLLALYFVLMKNGSMSSPFYSFAILSFIDLLNIYLKRITINLIIE